MNKEKRDKKRRLKESRQAKAEALRLLESPRFFNRFVEAVKQDGLVGEERNALVLFIVTVSRLLEHPLNALIHGESSSGKNRVASTVIYLLPKSEIREITSMSKTALDYLSNDYRHKVVYLQERNRNVGGVESIRTLISEGKLVRWVTTREGGRYVTRKYVARGPVAAISTVSSYKVKGDDANRHLALYTDLSDEQTGRIMRSYGRSSGLSPQERRVWRMVHRLIQQRSASDVSIPAWFAEVAHRLYKKDIRVRRYYPAFVEACRTVALIRSFSRQRNTDSRNALFVSFSDFALTVKLLDQVFVEILNRGEGPEFATRKTVEQISNKNEGQPISADELSKELRISMHRAYRMLRDAAEAGTVCRANKPERGNLKLFLPVRRPRFIPDPEELFQALKEVGTRVRFVHPLTGERVVYSRQLRRGCAVSFAVLQVLQRRYGKATER